MAYTEEYMGLCTSGNGISTVQRKTIDLMNVVNVLGHRYFI